MSSPCSSLRWKGRIVGWDLLTKDVPDAHKKDLDFLISMLDWEANVNPRFGESNKTFPRPVNPVEETKAEGFSEKWVTYGTPYYSAKELTVLPKRSGHHQGCCRPRRDRNPGLRHDRQSSPYRRLR